MRNFVITIPIDENIESCVRQIGLRMYSLNVFISEALKDTNPDLLFDFFSNIQDADSVIEYGFGLEITADKPQTNAEPIDIPQLEVMG